jgi:hypothetical protein
MLKLTSCPTNSHLSTRLYDKWDDFYFAIINFSNLDRNIERYKPLDQYTLCGESVNVRVAENTLWLAKCYTGRLQPCGQRHLFYFLSIIVTFEPNVNHLCRWNWKAEHSISWFCFSIYLLWLSKRMYRSILYFYKPINLLN